MKLLSAPVEPRQLSGGSRCTLNGSFSLTTQRDVHPDASHDLHAEAAWMGFL